MAGRTGQPTHLSLHLQRGAEVHLNLGDIAGRIQPHGAVGVANPGDGDVSTSQAEDPDVLEVCLQILHSFPGLFRGQSLSCHRPRP